MDPLSMIASILTVTEAVISGFKVFQKVRNTPADVQDAVEDLEKFWSVFKHMEETLIKPQVFSSLSPQTKIVLSSLLTTADTELTRLTHLLNERVIKCTHGPNERMQIRYTTWLLHGKDIRKTCGKLRELQNSLIMVNGAVNL
jgi:hypothetical protein